MAMMTDRTTDPDLDRLLKRYPYEILQSRNEQYQATRFHISYTDFLGVIHSTQFEVDDASTMRVRDPADAKLVVLEWLENACQELTVSIGEAITGDYPFARLWCDRHLTSRGKTEPYFGSPEIPIPGWAWPNIKRKSDYPEDGKVKRKPITITGDSERVIEETSPLRKKTTLLRMGVLDADLHGADADTILAGVEMATKRKVKVMKKAIDPSTIKKPNCKFHNSPMEFDPVTQKWRCGVEGCNLTARPKGDDTDREVRVGKGNIQCRLISNEGELTVVLISDDNVTLDISRFVDIPKLMDVFDAVTIADAASENGRETFSINDAKQLPIKMSLTVMGATDLVVNSDLDKD